jgi:uncharacterized YigZ family protein
MAGDYFLTLAGEGRAETRVKGSTFLSLARGVSSEDEARAALAAVQKEHHDATHNCSAWRLHTGVWRANDDGEPSGSAGAPILAAIEGAELHDCFVVVTRYYGGTKLGVGGLIRAYGEAAALALAAAPLRRAVPALRFRIRYGYDQTSAVMRLLERTGTFQVEHGYSSGGGEGEVVFTLPRESADALHEQLRESTAGALQAEQLEERTLYLAAGSELA